ncbi:MAG TPA: ABC transporter permease, partial [Acidilobales archaeon]|nr:ABC transporter permease [Acidilobales archaeon]
LSGFIMGVVGAAIMMVIVWLSFIESKRVYVLLRIRGSSKGDLFKLMMTEWVAVTLFLILLSIVLGIGSGFGVIKKMIPPLAYMLPFIGVDPSISIRSLVMLLLLTAIIVTSLILMVIKIYRGVARESLLRVM